MEMTSKWLPTTARPEAATTSSFAREDSVSKRFGLVCVFVGVLAVSGCTSSATTREVTGTVTFDDKPVEKGYIKFVPDDKTLGPDGGEITDGKFKLKAKPVPCHVEITASREVAGAQPDPMGTVPREDYIPEKYNVKTELTADVKSKDSFEFKLTK